MRLSRLKAYGTRPGLTAVALGLIMGSAQAQVQTPTTPPPEALSYYGDPAAPDLSGVWVRVDTSIAGSGSKEGWRPWPPPLKPPFGAMWKKRVADAALGTRTDDPVRRCVPPGMPRFMTGSNGPMLITQTPGRVLLYRDGQANAVRRIWLEQSARPAPKDLENFPHGTSIGRYEGSDLVTDVVGLVDRPIDSTGVPHSAALEIHERFHRVDSQTLKVSVTLSDATAYTRPMTTTVTYKLFADPAWEPKEFICSPETDFHPENFVR